MAKAPDIKTIMDPILKPTLCPALNRLITSTHTYSVGLPVSLFILYRSALKKKEVWYGISPVIIQFSSCFNYSLSLRQNRTSLVRCFPITQRTSSVLLLEFRPFVHSSSDQNSQNELLLLQTNSRV